MSTVARRLRTAAGRLALVSLGIVLAVLALEAVLQIGATVLALRGDAHAAFGGRGARRVLAVGDSNTYGLWLNNRAAEAYPAVFERLWNAADGAGRIEVFNAGYPGTNSSRLRRDLPRMLEAFAPDVVIVQVGSNDFWTAPVPVEPPPGIVRRAASWVARHSRVYQLAYMLSRAHERPALEIDYDPDRPIGALRFGDVEFADMGFQPAGTEPPGYRSALTDNLRAIVATIRAYGARPVLLTYGSQRWNYGEANAVTRLVAGETGVPLVDAATALAPRCPVEPCPTWLYADRHPTAAGHSVIAEALVHELGGQL